MGTPTVAPEPHHRVSGEPDVILQKLLGPTALEWREALEELGVDVKDPKLHIPETSDARLLRVNLDTDKELEAILIYTDNRPATHALILKKEKDGWWQVGDFHYWWHWNSEQAEHLIELREIVWPGRKDVIVRRVNGGSGATATDLSIYRMYGGRLYRVFETNENNENMATAEHSDLSYYDADSAEQPSIVVHRIKPRLSAETATRPKQSGCTGYAWNASKFAFVEDKAATTKFCAGSEGVKK